MVPGSTLFSDQAHAYVKVGRDYAHNVINHAEEYVRGNVHTNSIENFWSLLKRGIKGNLCKRRTVPLFRYLDEQSFRFITRKDNDQGRFMSALSSIQGKRVEYKDPDRTNEDLKGGSRMITEDRERETEITLNVELTPAFRISV